MTTSDDLGTGAGSVGTRQWRAPRWRLGALVASIAVILLLLMSGAVAAESPSPVATPTPLASPAPSPGATATTEPTARAACPNPVPSPTPVPVPGGTPVPIHPNLCPAPGPDSPKFEPLTGLLPWLFTPIFQVAFLGLVVLYNLIGDIGLAIIALTLVIRLLLVPVFRRQIVSTRRMQMLQPEIKAVQQKYRGDRTRIQQETMRLYSERGVNPAAGCLPSLVQIALLFPMYQVFREGLSAPNIDSMLSFAGFRITSVACYDAANPLAACINPTVHWLFNLNASLAEVIFNPLNPSDPRTIGGISILAILSAVLQLVQTRMVTPQTNDPQARAQQRTFLFLPLISIVYGGILPAGLFIYWIVTTIFSIVQQYLIVGWGSLFPIFGWTPSFAVDHTPRFPVAPATVSPARGGAPAASGPRGTALDRAAGTVRPSKQRGRTSRRGRRR